MTPTQIILRPLVTEKSNWESEARNRYSFQVHATANKTQIKDAVAAIYGVRVTAVSTQVRHGKTRRTRTGFTEPSQWKRATVQLHPEDKIDLF